MGGSLARARAIAARCCCPPDSVDGSFAALVGETHQLQEVEGTRAALRGRDLVHKVPSPA